jgi:hypothetical protein
MSNAQRYRNRYREAVDCEQAKAERDRLIESNNTLKLALSDAIKELDSLSPPLEGARYQRYMRWMDGLRAALEQTGGHDEVAVKVPPGPQISNEIDPLDGRDMRCRYCGYRTPAELIQFARYDCGCPRCGESLECFILIPERERYPRSPRKDRRPG